MFTSHSAAQIEVVVGWLVLWLFNMGDQAGGLAAFWSRYEKVYRKAHLERFCYKLYALFPYTVKHE